MRLTLYQLTRLINLARNKGVMTELCPIARDLFTLTTSQQGPTADQESS